MVLLENLKILEKPLWSLEDIQQYFQIGRTKASAMMQAAKKISSSKFIPSKAKRDVILELNNMEFKKEVDKLKYLEG